MSEATPYIRSHSTRKQPLQLLLQRLDAGECRVQLRRLRKNRKRKPTPTVDVLSWRQAGFGMMSGL